jgi:excisionase family DNA binding protein
MQNTRDLKPQPLLLNMAQASQVLCLGKSKIYELMEAEGLPYTKLGKSLRFPYDALQRWVEQRLRQGAA